MTLEPDTELTAMSMLIDALGSLDESIRTRVLGWAVARWGAQQMPKVTPAASEPPPAPPQPPVTAAADVIAAPPPAFSDLGELFATLSPTSDADKVLVVGYWLQFVEGGNELSGYEVNKELRHMGHGVGNVTTAFDTLKARKPAPVIQLKKSGTSKQARKTYKLTLAGKQAVEAMMPRP